MQNNYGSGFYIRARFKTVLIEMPGRQHDAFVNCELLDVETLITKLYLSGKLTDEQLNVMKKFGDRRRAPHQYIWSENRAAALWHSAMDTINIAATKRGWIE